MQTDDPIHQDSTQTVSARSTKQEIFAAYQELLRDFQKKASDVKGKRETKQAFENEVIEKASGYSIEHILEAISTLDSHLRKSLQDLAEKLIRESQKLRELQEAIRIEQENLENTKKITVAVDTLENLIGAEKAQEQEFEEEMERKRNDFQREMQSKRDAWKREQEEYEYELQINRKKEEHKYAEKRALEESQLAEREKALSALEKELADLRERSGKFPSELEAAVQKAQEDMQREVRKEEQIKADLLKEKYDGERRIATLTIDTLKERVKSLETEIGILKEQLASATKEIKDVAVKVIEGRSRFEEAQRIAKLLEQKGHEGK